MADEPRVWASGNPVLETNIARTELYNEAPKAIASAAAQLLRGDLAGEQAEIARRLVLHWDAIVSTAPGMPEADSGVHLAHMRRLREILLDNIECVPDGKRTVVRARVESYGRLAAEQQGESFIAEAPSISR